jgi:hypothetical protein
LIRETPPLQLKLVSRRALVQLRSLQQLLKPLQLSQCRRSQYNRVSQRGEGALAIKAVLVIATSSAQ